MKRTGLLVLSMVVCTSCTLAPTRIDNIPDPRDSAEYKKLISHGSSVDFEGDEQVRFKPGLPLAGQSINTSVTFGAPSFQYLDGFLVIVLHTKGFNLRVSGHTDLAECQADECSRLSQRRADAVYALLLRKGFPATRISKPTSYGSSAPLTSNESEEDRARERRVEISIEQATND